MKRTILAMILIIVAISVQSQKKTTDPAATEVWNPVPEVINPGTNNLPPSDAIILLGKDKDLSQWLAANKGSVKWDMDDGVLTVKKKTGGITTKKAFGDCQLHVEWRAPSEVVSESQGRGNSGIYLMGKYEVQVLDSYNNLTYPNGQAASIYKQHIPLVNVCRPPGEWQEYDIIWKAPQFSEDGSVSQPAYITVLHNGVLVQNHVALKGPTVYIGIPAYKAHPEKLPLLLQEHGNPVSYRNIWIRDL